MTRRLCSLLAALLLSTGAHATCSTGALPVTLTEGTTAHATDVMANFNQIVSGVATNCAGSGANTDITSITGLTTPLGYTIGGSSYYIGGTSTGSANAQAVATLTPIGFTLTAGKSAGFLAGFTNTGSTTLNINSTGATAVFRQTPSGPQALTGGEIVVNTWVVVYYDGTQYQLVSNGPQFGGFGALTNLAAAVTTDFGTIPSHNINITGSGVNISSFGSTASTTFPFYRVTFANNNTLVYNGASLILPTNGSNITTIPNDTALAMYLGGGNWQLVEYQRAAGTSVIAQTPLCGISGLRIRNDLSNSGGTVAGTLIEYSADSAVMIASGNVPIFRASGISGNLDVTTGGAGTSTANGMDGSARPTSNWLYIYLIDNGTTTAALGSNSSTAPTLPSGYTYICRAGAMLFDPSQNAYRSLQLGNRTQWLAVAGSNTVGMQTLGRSAGGATIGGGCTTPTWAALNVSSAVPPTATQIFVTAQNLGTGAADVVCVAPNKNYLGLGSGQPPFISAGVTNAISVTNVVQGVMVLESGNVFWAGVGNAGGSLISLRASGFVDKVNAN